MTYSEEVAFIAVSLAVETPTFSFPYITLSISISDSRFLSIKGELSVEASSYTIISEIG